MQIKINYFRLGRRPRFYGAKGRFKIDRGDVRAAGSRPSVLFAALNPVSGAKAYGPPEAVVFYENV